MTPWQHAATAPPRARATPPHAPRAAGGSRRVSRRAGSTRQKLPSQTAAHTPAARTRTAAARSGRRGRPAPGKQARGLDAAEVAIAIDSPVAAPLVALVREAGGAPIGAYREPLGGRALLLASLPLNALQPTPFQRDLSPTHARRLAAKIDETAAFLDPLIVDRKSVV